MARKKKPTKREQRAPRDASQQAESLTDAAAETVKSMAQAVVSTGIRGMQTMARLGRAAAEGAVAAGDRAGGTMGEMVAETTQATVDTASRLGDASARTASRTARTMSEAVKESAQSGEAIVDRSVPRRPTSRARNRRTRRAA